MIVHGRKMNENTRTITTSAGWRCYNKYIVKYVVKTTTSLRIGGGRVCSQDDGGSRRTFELQATQQHQVTRVDRVVLHRAQLSISDRLKITQSRDVTWDRARLVHTVVSIVYTCMAVATSGSSHMEQRCSWPQAHQNV